MSQSICWEPVVPKDPETLCTWAPSNFKATMEAAGLELPCNIGQSDVATIRGMAAVWGDRDHNPYKQLLEILEKHDTIHLWAE